jgi:hypothetical protein
MAMVALASLALLSIRPNIEFPAVGGQTTQAFQPLSPGFAWDEAIVSWNLENPVSAGVRVEARAWRGDTATKWYTIADWAADTAKAPRVSVEGQKDADGDVDTDTFVLKSPADRLELRATLKTLAEGPRPRLRLLTASFANTKEKTADHPVPSPAWGKTIDVPQRAQGDYPNGSVLCSATSTSMLLWHYSRVLNRPELDRDVPEVEASVWDSVYNGAGNWPFNVAYSGSFPGMRAYVARFAGISDLEKWIDAGLPVACSVSFDMLKGALTGGSGHLVVLVGFTKDGDPVINDPARRGDVRHVYKRADFERAWLYSKRTVYIVHPESAKPPKGGEGRWLED